MQKIPLDVISSIQKKLNIVDVIGKYLPLKRQGKNYFAICPFHDDHNPSLSISEEKQIYTCFVCGASGNVFNFVKDYEKISFVKSVSMLGKQVGIDIDINESLSLKKEDENKKYFDMYDIVNKYYQNNIKSKYGEKAKDDFELGVISLIPQYSNISQFIAGEEEINSQIVDGSISATTNYGVKNTRNNSYLGGVGTGNQFVEVNGKMVYNDPEKSTRRK